jgi:hypothetical protein
LQAYLCNSSYVNGLPEAFAGCALVAQKSPSELQDDGTKFRGIFTKNLIDTIGDVGHVILKTDLGQQNKYYYIKTYKARAGGYTTHWNYSIDNGITWLNLGDGYETELNINWFYDGADPTAFIYNLWANTTNGTESNLVGNITWSIDATNNYPPLTDLIRPEMNETISIPYNVTFTITDPNDDNLNASLLLYQGGVLNKTLITDMNSSNTSYYWTTSQAPGVYNLTLLVCELGTAESYCVNDTHEYIIVVVDSPPYWSNNQSNIVTTYSPSTSSSFNITWQDNNNVTSVWFESNYSGSSQNYSMNNLAGDIYNYFAVLPAGNYYWKSYANDTINQWSETDLWSFTIARATTTLTLVASPNWTVINNTQTNISCSADNNKVNATLFRNDTLIGGSVGGTVSDVQTLNVGDYGYVCNNTAQNYTADSESNTLRVSLKNPSNCFLSFNPASPQTYGTALNASCSCSNPEATTQLFRNGTNVTDENNQLITLAVGDHGYICNVSETQNYTSASDSSIYIINQATPVLSLIASPSWSEVNGTQTTVSCSANTAEVNVSLFRNSTYIGSSVGSTVSDVQNLSIGTYGYLCNNTPSQNYTSTSTSNTLTISEFVPSPPAPSGGGGGRRRVVEVVEEVPEEVVEELVEERPEKVPEVEVPEEVVKEIPAKITTLARLGQTYDNIKSWYKEYAGVHMAIVTNLLVLLIFAFIFVIMVQRVVEERKMALSRDIKLLKKQGFVAKETEDSYIEIGARKKRRKKK